ncbi:MAG: hypothetical protein HYU63_04055 [Armatimonadetes bacterium]|nr:hypothetical protein [Armatimonadota bacterium]
MNNFSWQDSVYSDGNKEFLALVKSKKGNFLKIKIRMYKKNDLKIIYLITAPEGERIYTPMKIIKEEELLWFSQSGLSKITPLEYFNFRYYLDFKEIKWLNKSVFYQILPDRFYDGNSQTNVKDDEYFYDNYPAKISKWGENPKDYKNGHHLDFFGGDLEGIKKKIPYFKALGINALYLNPIFLSPSNHKYDTQDYFQIDPHFGTNEEFANLVKLLHQNKISIILDGVFNHTGMAHYWFNKSNFYLKEGAYQNIKSPYGEYFTFYDYPEDYHTWRDVKTLPKLNYQSLKLCKVIYQAEDSIAKFWLKAPYNIDGWRLDVANMLARQGEFQGYKEVWREFRKEIKKVNQDAYILGEHFYDPGELLQGDMLDAAMNYQGFSL